MRPALLLICFLIVHQSWSQVNFTQSDLSIILIDTEEEIVDEPKVPATIRILSNDDGNNNLLTDDPVFSGLCGIEIRGESTQFYEKQSYGFEMWDSTGADIDTSFLGFAAEEDFILYGPYADKSMMNNVIAMHLARGMGQYASETRYLELVINGEYRGVYVLMEKIKRDKNRVDIAKLRPEDIEGDELTGGYIFRIDKGDYDGWFSDYLRFDNDIPIYYQFYYPNDREILPEQAAYIQEYMDAFESTVNEPDKINSNGQHYTSYISLRSFVDNMIMIELAKNADGYRLSTYFHKDKDSNGGRLRCGPQWDYNFSYGNADYCGTEFTTGWLYYQCTGNSPEWWDILFQDEVFTNALKCRYTELREGLLSDESMIALVDSLDTEIAKAQERNYEKYQILGNYIWPNPDFFAFAPSHEAIVDILRDWLLARLNWLDSNIPGEGVDCGQYDDPDFEIPPSAVTDVDKLGIKVYPNPASEYMILESESPIQSYRIYSIMGHELIRQENVGAHFHKMILFPDLAVGFYLIEIQISGNTIYRSFQVTD